MIVRTRSIEAVEAFAVARKADRFGRSKSLKWPWLYDKLRAKGYDKSKAAAISNSRIGVRKRGRLNVLPAAQAHKPSVLRKLAEADKAGKHATESQLTGRKRKRKSVTASALFDAYMAFSNDCHSPKDGRFCSSPVHRSVSRGVMAKGAESKRMVAGVCGKKAADGSDLCSGHQKQAAAMAEKLAAKRGKTFPVITASEARGDSRPVSHAEFQRLANKGAEQLAGFKARSAPIKGLDDNWDKIKEDGYTEVKKSWGGATIDSHTGKALPQGANKYAITVKDPGLQPVSIREKATRREFDAAMDLARERFRPILEREGHHLGIFHDDDMKRIDIDPVLVVTKRADVDTIGAATRAIGGAYNFADGNGYWPPHVVE